MRLPMTVTATACGEKCNGYIIVAVPVSGAEKCRMDVVPE